MSPELAAEIRYMPQTPSSRQGRLLENVLKARDIDQSDKALLKLTRYNDSFDPEVINDMDEESFDMVFRLMIDYRRQQTKYFWHAHIVLDDLVRTRCDLLHPDAAQELLVTFMHSNFDEARDTTRSQSDRDFVLSNLRHDAVDIDIIEQYGGLLTRPIMTFFAEQCVSEQDEFIRQGYFQRMQQAVQDDTVRSIVDCEEMDDLPVLQQLLRRNKTLYMYRDCFQTPLAGIDLTGYRWDREYNLN
jgi:hypothetical protein